MEVAHKKKDYEVKDPERAFGRESRSLKAAHALVAAGFKNIAHLEGGVFLALNGFVKCSRLAS